MRIGFSLLISAACLAALSTSCMNDNGMKEMNATMAKNKAVVEKLNSAFETGDTTIVDSILADNAVDHTPGPGMTGSTKHQLSTIITMFHTAFPDGKNSEVAITADGDWVSVYATYSATNTGSFMGMPATNKPIKADYSDFFKLKDGKITDHWGVFDFATLMQQLMPAPGMAADSSGMKMPMK